MEPPVMTGPTPAVPPSPNAFPIFATNPLTIAPTQGEGAPTGPAVSGSGPTLHVIPTGPLTAVSGTLSAGALQLTAATIPMSPLSQQAPAPVPASPGITMVAQSNPSSGLSITQSQPASTVPGPTQTQAQTATVNVNNFYGTLQSPLPPAAQTHADSHVQQQAQQQGVATVTMQPIALTAQHAGAVVVPPRPPPSTSGAHSPVVQGVTVAQVGLQSPPVMVQVRPPIKASTLIAEAIAIATAGWA